MSSGTGYQGQLVVTPAIMRELSYPILLPARIFWAIGPALWLVNHTPGLTRELKEAKLNWLTGRINDLP